MKRLQLLALAFVLSLLAAPAQADPSNGKGKGVGLAVATSNRPTLSVAGPAIPEPTGALLFGAGVLAAAYYTRKRRTA